LGSAVIGGVSLASSCKSALTSAVSTLVNPPPASSQDTTSPPPNSSSSTSSTSDTNILTTSAATTTGLFYEPPAAQPLLIRVPDSECTIATDRLYSDEYIWVKSISSNLVVIGATPTLITIISRPYALTLDKIHDNLIRDNRFGDIEGQKVNSDLISPVSGEIVQVNEVVVKQGMGQGEYMPTVNSDPWNSGWMLVVQLANEEELKDLMTPQEFLAYLGH
jgi:glycine cleavage system H protein